MPPTADGSPAAPADSDGRATAAYVAPFLIYVGLMGIEHMLKLPIMSAYSEVVRAPAGPLSL